MIMIHGKKYFTVAERLKDAHKSGELISITTEYLPNTDKIVCRATVTMKNGRSFTGTSAADPSKSIEKMSPYEVSETSAVGRALAFAGFKVTDDIASADEMEKQDSENVQASMYDTNHAIEKIEELKSMESDEEKLAKIENVLKGLVEAKSGKRYLTKLFVKDITEKANNRIEEKKLEMTTK